MRTVSVLIPWRSDHGRRQELFEWVLPRWAGVDVCIGEDNGAGPFNRNLALNRAAAQAVGHVFVVVDADHVPDVEHARAMAGIESWQVMYNEARYLSAADTDRVLTGDTDPRGCVPERRDRWAQSHIALHRTVYEAIGGFDEAFHGWGWEDAATKWALSTRFGRSVPLPRCAWFLHHEPAPRDRQRANKQLFIQRFGRPPPKGLTDADWQGAPIE